MNQTTGYLKINGEKILVLCRINGWIRHFKMRKTGDNGVFFEDESYYLSDRPEVIKNLKLGKSIKIT